MGQEKKLALITGAVDELGGIQRFKVHTQIDGQR